MGWGNNVHVNLHTHTHTSCYAMVILGWGGVGWGNNVHVNLHTHVMLRYGYLGVGWGGVGWGNNVHVELAAGQQSLGSSALETLKKKIWQQVAGGS